MISEGYRERERETAFANIKRRMREARERRTERIAAQHGEGLAKTVGRTLYLTACVLFDGVVLLELVRILPGATGWAAFLLALSVAIPLQVKGYRAWFDPLRT